MRNLSKRLWEIQRRERIYFWVEGRGGFWYFSTKLQINLKNSVQFSSVAQLCPTLCDPVNCSTPGLPVHHQLLEFTQTHVHQVDVPSSHLILCHPLLLLPPRICRFNPWVRKIPWRRKWHPIPVFLPGESHGQRSLEGYSPWGHKELDTTEWLNMYAHYISLHRLNRPDTENSGQKRAKWIAQYTIMFPSAGFKDFPDFYKSMVRPPFSSSDTPRSPIITKKKAVNGIKDLRSPKRHSGLMPVCLIYLCLFQTSRNPGQQRTHRNVSTYTDLCPLII